MSAAKKVPVSHATHPQASAADSYLGAATVTKVAGRTIGVALADGKQVDAQLALAVPYRPLRRDEVLVLGDGAQWFVIGVLNGRGRVSLDADTVELTARGRLLLDAKEAIRFRALRIDLLARGAVVAEVGEVVKRSRRLMQFVGERLSLVARDADQVVERRWQVQAARACLKVADVFHANGKTVRLG